MRLKLNPFFKFSRNKKYYFYLRKDSIVFHIPFRHQIANKVISKTFTSIFSIKNNKASHKHNNTFNFQNVHHKKKSPNIKKKIHQTQRSTEPELAQFDPGIVYQQNYRFERGFPRTYPGSGGPRGAEAPTLGAAARPISADNLHRKRAAGETFLCSTKFGRKAIDPRAATVKTLSRLTHTQWGCSYAPCPLGGLRC